MAFDSGVENKQTFTFTGKDAWILLVDLAKCARTITGTCKKPETSWRITDYKVANASATSQMTFPATLQLHWTFCQASIHAHTVN